MDEIDRVREGEEANYKFARQAVGDSASLIQDLVDLYGLLGDLVRASGLPPDDGVVAASQFLLACRYQLTIGALTALRGHINDSFYFTRKAIELCAFAVRVDKHPHLAMVWLQAGRSGNSYERYRKKFSPGKLFPSDHELLGTLYDRYDHCSKFVHPSAYSLAGHIEVERSTDHIDFKFNYFQLQDRAPSEPIRTILWIVDTHFGILRVFQDILKEAIAHDQAKWEIRRNAVDAKIGLHKSRWKSVIMPEEPKRESSA